MLDVLLSHALLDLTRATERRGDDVNVVQWANLLRLLDEDGFVRVKELPVLARLSKRAVTSVLVGPRRLGWLDEDDVGAVRLTPSGRQARDQSAAAVAAAEAAWCDAHGEDAARLRVAVTALVDQLELELPWYPTGYGPADVSVNGGVYAKGGRGADWKPVVRSDADSVAGLPLLALLSQALVAFTLDYEATRRGSLAYAAFLDAFTSEPVPLAEVPAALGVVGNGKSALERHGIVKVEAKQARLTQIGHARRQSYEPMVAKVTEAWRERYGDELIGELRGSLERLDAELPAGLAPHPVVRHVVGTGFREMSAAG